MSGWHRSIRIGATILGVIGPMIGFTATPATAAPRATVTTIASGLDNPRGLAFGDDGHLLVAEAGHGGPQCVNLGPFGDECVGFSSGISAITRSGPHRIVSGLASFAPPTGFGASGADGLSRSEDGALYTIITSCPQSVDQLTPSLSTISGLKAQLGQVVKVTGHGQFKTMAGVGAFDWDWTNTHKNLVPGQFPDCNPYGILAGEHDQWVVDAASNTLDHVRSDGSIEVVAFFPNPPVSDAVPTCIARGPDGALYIGELTGSGNQPGASVVWRVDTRRENPQPTKWASGLTALTGCGFAEDGKFYATEFSVLGLDKAAPGTGAVVRVPAGSTSPTMVVDKLDFPGGFAAGPEGSIYVSNWSTAPADSHGGPTGQVIRISRHGRDD